MVEHPEGAIYGTIAVGALLAAESARGETYGRTVGAVVITLLIYWFARSYSDFAGQRLRVGGRLTFGGLMRTMGAQLSILAGAAIPLVSLLIWWVTGGSLADAVSAAVWTSAGLVLTIELVAGVRAGLSGTHLVLQAALGGLLGLMVILLKVLLH
jgi:hypothetical protein